ncbi:hypothetical protein BH23ACT2_BH23ACT2_28690 [soil metagenome]
MRHIPNPVPDVVCPNATTPCAVCATPVRDIQSAGWRHLDGFAARGGCTTPWPAPEAKSHRAVSLEQGYLAAIGFVRARSLRGRPVA